MAWFSRAKPFLRLPPEEQAWLLAAIALRLALSVSRRITPYRLWRILLVAALQGPHVRSPRRRFADSNPNTAKHEDRIIGSVARSDQFPGVGRCMERALAAYLLLRCCGVPCKVRLGVGWDSQRRLVAHAWLEAREQVYFRDRADGLTQLPFSNDGLQATGRPAGSKPSPPCMRTESHDDYDHRAA